jgi:hypothetical protein
LSLLQSASAPAPHRFLPRRHSSQFGTDAPSLGFARPSDDISRSYRCCRGHSNSRDLPPLTFLTPSTVCTTTHLASLFHPAAESRIITSRVFPSLQPTRFITEPLPSCRFSRGRCRCKHLRRDSRAPPPRLCSTVKSVVRTAGFNRHSARAPHVISLLQVLPSATGADAFTPASTLDLRAQSTRYRAWASSVLTDHSLTALFRVRRPARGLCPPA